MVCSDLEQRQREGQSRSLYNQHYTKLLQDYKECWCVYSAIMYSWNMYREKFFISDALSRAYVKNCKETLANDDIDVTFTKQWQKKLQELKDAIVSNIGRYCKGRIAYLLKFLFIMNNIRQLIICTSLAEIFPSCSCIFAIISIHLEYGSNNRILLKKARNVRVWII